MNQQDFDNLTRQLAAAPSRRQVFRTLAAGVLAGLFSRGRVVTAGEVAAQSCSSADYKKCLDQATLEYGANKSVCDGSDAEGSQEEIGGGTLDALGSICKIVVARTYFEALEQCATKQCSNGKPCINDECCETADCCPGGKQCGSDSALDPEAHYCCATADVCCRGACCTPPLTCCRNVDFGLPFGLRDASVEYVCTDLKTDNKNCGTCDNTCDADEQCCDGVCKNVKQDEQNCGACGRVCGSGETCCDGGCYDTKTSEQHCGFCGNACPQGQECCSGTCQQCCAPYKPCGDACYNPDNCEICENGLVVSACKECEQCQATPDPQGGTIFTCVPQKKCGDQCCDPATPCAPEGGCCPAGRICQGGSVCCPQGQQCITRSDGSSFCCAATQACQNGFGGELRVCCGSDQSCKCGLNGCFCS